MKHLLLFLIALLACLSFAAETTPSLADYHAKFPALLERLNSRPDTDAHQQRQTGPDVITAGSYSYLNFTGGYLKLGVTKSGNDPNPQIFTPISGTGSTNHTFLSFGTPVSIASYALSDPRTVPGESSKVTCYVNLGGQAGAPWTGSMYAESETDQRLKVVDPQGVPGDEYRVELKMTFQQTLTGANPDYLNGVGKCVIDSYGDVQFEVSWVDRECRYWGTVRNSENNTVDIDQTVGFAVPVSYTHYVFTTLNGEFDAAAIVDKIDETDSTGAGVHEVNTYKSVVEYEVVGVVKL